MSVTVALGPEDIIQLSKAWNKPEKAEEWLAKPQQTEAVAE